MLFGIFVGVISTSSAVRGFASDVLAAVSGKSLASGGTNALYDRLDAMQRRLDSLQDTLDAVHTQLTPYYVDPNDPAFTIGGINPEELAKGRPIIYRTKK